MTTVDAAPVSSGASEHVRGVTPWIVGIVIVSFAPLLMLGLGVDFSSGMPALSPKAAASLSIAELGDAAHQSLRGSFTHTILEWTAVCAAAFVVILAFVHFRLTKEPSLPIIGVALACAGAMDAFHTLAADRLITSVADNIDLIPFTWAICRLFNAMIMVVGVGLFAFSRGTTLKRGGGSVVILASAGFIAAAYLIIHACATSGSLPQTMFPNAVHSKIVCVKLPRSD